VYRTVYTTGYTARLPTGEAIESWYSRNKLLHTIDPLPLSAALHWVGPRSSTGNVLLYFHGGSYNNPLLAPGHVAFALRCASKGSASLAMPEYTLAATAHYPAKLTPPSSHGFEACPCQHSPIQDDKISDSASGHLSAALLSHLFHSLKDIEALRLSKTLGGICFKCPFLSFDYENESYKYNENRDYLSLHAVKELNSSFKPLGQPDEDAIKGVQLPPLDAPRGWWNDSTVERILVVAGNWEMFVDDCIAFGVEPDCPISSVSQSSVELNLSTD
jgi:hypothetical protein